MAKVDEVRNADSIRETRMQGVYWGNTGCSLETTNSSRPGGRGLGTSSKCANKETKKSTDERKLVLHESHATFGVT